MVSLSSRVTPVCLLLMLFAGVFFSISAVPEKQCALHEVKKVDQIAVKQHEMLGPVVRIGTRQSTGSGTIYEKVETEVDGTFEYLVLTNHHITVTRMVFSFTADFMIGSLIKIPIDTGCSVVVFDHEGQKTKRYTAKVVAEDAYLDLAILSFRSDQPIPVALLATNEMLEDVRVFDDVFAVGCQLGMRPTPTVGIISGVISGVTNKIEWMLYGTTTPITYGSSGGGLFREYDGHYYLIGIPFRVAMTPDYQVMSHLGNAIALTTARKILEENMVSKE